MTQDPEETDGQPGGDGAAEPDEAAGQETPELPRSRVPPGVVYAGVGVLVVATGVIVAISFFTGNYLMGVIGLGVLIAFAITSRPKDAS